MQKNQDSNQINEESQIVDFNNPDYSFIPADRHQWIQQGPYLVCQSCELKHAVRIGMDKVMVGETEDGQPILKKRSELTQG